MFTKILSIYKLIKEDSEWEKRIPLIGTLAAFIFAAQIVNFPVEPFVSGHLGVI